MVQFQQGKEFYNQGAFERAAIALKRAYELRPGYRILYFLGWAENEIGNYTRALEAFNGFLAELQGALKDLRIGILRVEKADLENLTRRSPRPKTGAPAWPADAVGLCGKITASKSRATGQ